MPAETSGDEPITPEPTEEDKGLVVEPIVRSIGTISILLIFWAMWRLMDSDEVQLHILNFLVRFLQAIARIIGAWAITAESNYNKVVDSLH